MSGMAKYADIAADLREKIAGGQYSPGDQLPSEPELGEAYGVSRITIRSAIDALRTEGLLTSEHGKGVFVTPPRTVKRINSRERLSRARRAANRSHFLAEAENQGFTPSSNVKVRFEPAGEFGEVLGIDAADEVTVRDRVMRADGKPVQLAVSRLPRDVTRDTVLETVETGPGGAHARLEESHGLTSFAETVSARPATTDERTTLASLWVLCVRRLAYSGDRVLECNDMVMPADRYELEYTWAAD